jgi:ABC-type transport system involved in cytochrome c biogenesis permease subunit
MKDGKADAFNTEAARYLGLLEGTLPTDTHRAELEQMKNRAEPFYQTSVLYVFAFILAALGLLMANVPNSTWPTTLARTALAVILVAFVMHTIGIGTRIYLQGRPPVTNLYSSAIFIGWAAIPIALAAEWFLRLGLGNVVASLIGFATLVVAHNLDDGGDTMEMMQAVLDSNFWLATHVVVITIGYSATYLAGFIAAAYVVLGLFTRSLGPGAMKSLPKMIYGVVCFATLTSFVGTVLGGIWADQSWGRFWGWDPKENGAALIVFINLIILHARWGGMIRDRGLAALAIFGNIVTSWSWFGTNMLGVGLHSYGFIASAAFWLTAFCLSQLGLMMLALVPHRYWRSVRAPAPAPESGVREPQPSPAS